MTFRAADTVPGTPRRDEVRAVHGARWIATAAVIVGALNYLYALALTRLMDVGSYAVFAAGQGLILCTAAVAVVTVPWMLAQGLARARSAAERGDAIRFAVVTGAAGGILASCAVAAVATQFADVWTTLILAVSTLLIYVTRVTVGWLQGTERLRTLATVTTSEAVLKLAVGLLLVAALGMSEQGALAAFGIAVLPFVVCRPKRPRGGRRRWLSVTADRALWRRAGSIASVQGLVALMVSVDVVMVAILPTDRAGAASYQASVMVGRIPLFIAGAVAMAFFPALSRRSAGTPLASSAVRMYLLLAVPLTTVVATMPGAVLTTVFSSEYAAMGGLLAFTAVSGFALGGLGLVTTFSQAVNDYRCLPWQAVGLLGYVAALVAGWHAEGVRGMAIGAMCGSVAVTVLLAWRLVRRGAVHPPAWTVLREPLALAGVLLVLRPHVLLWLVAALATGARAAWLFFGSRGAQAPEPGTPHGRTSRGRGSHRPPVGERAAELVVDAVWHGQAPPASDDELHHALAIARRNQVEGRLARAYPRQLAAELSAVDDADRDFRRNLLQATDRLRAAGIPTVLIKADLSGDHEYSNFDLVVPDGTWRAADEALSDWYVHRSSYWLERSTKVLLRPARGPAAHLHTAVSWFGVPVMSTERLFARAVPCDGHGWLVPNPADQLRIWLAHGLFQNLALDLSELLALRDLLRQEVVAEARREARREGWPAGSRLALGTAVEAVERLDRGLVVQLPMPLPVSTSLRVAIEHAGHLTRRGRASTAAREAALRVPLVLAKRLKAAGA